MSTPTGKMQGVARVQEIRAAQQRVKAQIDSIERQLRDLDRKHIPDSQPWISFKRVNSILELKSDQPTLRNAWRHDISEFRESYRRLHAELEAARRANAQLAVAKAKRHATVHSRDFQQRLEAVLRKGEASGELQQDELETIIGDGESTLDEFISVLDTTPSTENMAAVLKHQQILSTLGRDSDKAFGALRRATGRLLDESTNKLRNHPTRANMKAVLERSAMAQLVGNDRTDDAFRTVLDAAIKIRKTTEQQFRSTPTVSNLRAMMQMDREVQLLGGDPLPYPPPGIPSVPRGTTHIVQAGETLSEISRRYFGSPGYWDVIVMNNPTAIRDPNVLTVGTKLIIA